jgi:hypothetical protein
VGDTQAEALWVVGRRPGVQKSQEAIAGAVEGVDPVQGIGQERERRALPPHPTRQGVSGRAEDPHHLHPQGPQLGVDGFEFLHAAVAEGAPAVAEEGKEGLAAPSFPEAEKPSVQGLQGELGGGVPGAEGGAGLLGHLQKAQGLEGPYPEDEGPPGVEASRGGGGLRKASL